MFTTRAAILAAVEQGSPPAGPSLSPSPPPPPPPLPACPIVVRLRNQAVRLPRWCLAPDPWARDPPPASLGGQAALVSVEAGMRRPAPQLAGAAQGSGAGRRATWMTDALGADTLNYGKLSKAVRKVFELIDAEKDMAPAAVDMHLNTVFAVVWGCLVGQRPSAYDNVAGWDINAALVDQRGLGDIREVREAMGDSESFRYLTVELHLPRATLLGTGVTLSYTEMFDETRGANRGPGALSVRWSGISVPTLVGVNPHERTAKQVVVVDLELEKYSFGFIVFHEVYSCLIKVGLLPPCQAYIVSRELTCSLNLKDPGARGVCDTGSTWLRIGSASCLLSPSRNSVAPTASTR